MKIQGIAGNKHPNLRKGDVIELSPERKVIEMAKEAFPKRSPEGYLRVVLAAELVGEVRTLKGREGVRTADGGQYWGEVKLRYRPLRQSDDRLFREKIATVKLHCVDSKNEMGMPDLRVESYEEKV